jgi:lipopolysaccharide/colanic/teichoic acid biosynthesis glycosyltransferase
LKWGASPVDAMAPPRVSYTALKRLLDVVAAVLLLLFLAPLLALCALAIRLESPGPVLFRQQRVGEGGRLFTMLKLRSMYASADVKAHRDYVASFIHGRAQPAAQEGLFKLVADPRVTRVGRWLRRTSLDELPQLWNVLRGEMSLVGPRPPIAYELEHYQPAHFGRLRAKPGITGLWQVSGRNRTTFEQMVALDLEYIQTRSLGMDLWILLRTIPVVFLRADAR